MSDTKLLDKALKAGYDYRAVYGKFPDKIGIHVKQLGLLPFYLLFILDPPPIEIALLADEPSLADMTIHRHEVRIEPVMGPDIYPDEVYFPAPGDESKCISSAFVAKLAREFEP